MEGKCCAREPWLHSSGTFAREVDDLDNIVQAGRGVTSAKVLLTSMNMTSAYEVNISTWHGMCLESSTRHVYLVCLWDARRFAPYPLVRARMCTFLGRHERVLTTVHRTQHARVGSMGKTERMMPRSLGRPKLQKSYYELCRPAAPEYCVSALAKKV